MDKKSTLSKEISGLSFEEAIKKLEDIVQQMENRDVNLEEFVNNYEYGNMLRKHCDTKIREAKTRIDKIIDADKEVVEPFAD